jgi:hypothetical protein
VKTVKTKIRTAKVGDWLDHERHDKRHCVATVETTNNGPVCWTYCGLRWFLVSTMIDNTKRSNKGFCDVCCEKAPGKFASVAE